MKKTICLVLCLCIPMLSGCGGIYGNFREIERLEVVDTMGIDYIPGGVRICFSSASGTGAGEGLVLTGTGDSIDSAIEQIQRRCSSEELFFRQIEYIIIGESAAKYLLGDILAYICRSSLTRIDTPLFVVRGKDASTLIADCRGNDSGISEIMEGIVHSSDGRGDMQVSSAADVLQGLLSRGSTVITALEQNASSKSGSSSTASVSGYGIIKGDRLISFLEQEQAMGFGFLTGNTGLCSVTVTDSRGGKAVLDITEGSLNLRPSWARDGSLELVEVSVKAEASAAEIEGSGDMENAVYLRHLTGQLEESISENINAVLRTSASLGADFAGLGRLIEQQDVERYRKLPPMEQLLASLQFQVSVSGTVNHANDMDGNLQQKLKETMINSARTDSEDELFSVSLTSRRCRLIEQGLFI